MELVPYDPLTAFSSVIECGDFDFARLLLDKERLDINARLDLQQRTILHNAVRSEWNIDSIKGLIFLGANVNLRDMFGRTPLHYAALNGNMQLCKLLIEYGANPMISD